MAITLDEAKSRVDDFHDRVQIVSGTMTALATEAEQLGDSQGAFHSALGVGGADLDHDTVSSVGSMHATTGQLEDGARALANGADKAVAYLTASREHLGAHDRLDEEMKAQDPGKAGFYDPQ